MTTVEDVTVTPVAIGGPAGAPTCRPCARTAGGCSRWSPPSILIAFVVYATWAAFANKDYYVGAAAHRDLHLALLLALPRRQLRARQPSRVLPDLVDDLAGASSS